MATPDNKCCRPLQPQVHTPRARHGPRSTITTPWSASLIRVARISGAKSSAGSHPRSSRPSSGAGHVCHGRVSTVIRGNLAGRSHVWDIIPRFAIAVRSDTHHSFLANSYREDALGWRRGNPGYDSGGQTFAVCARLSFGEADEWADVIAARSNPGRRRLATKRK